MATNYDLLVLGPGIFENTLQQLLEHKNRLGTRTRFVSIEKIRANPRYATGSDIQEKIKLAIDYFNRCHAVRYVLIVGDVDRFPVRYIRKWDAIFWGNSFVPSDLYYADLRDRKDSFSHWDGNGNGMYGEMNAREGWTTNWNELNRDRVELKPDVAVGRLPVSTTEELERAIAKIIAYENTGGSAWKDRALLVTGDFDVSTSAAREIARLLEDNGYRVTTLFWEDQPDWTDPDGTNGRARSLNREFARGVGLVLYLGHGSEKSWVNWYRDTDVGLANNSGRPPIILSAACSTANFAFKERDDGAPYYATMDCTDYGCRCEDDHLYGKDATFTLKGGDPIRGWSLFSSGDYADYTVGREGGTKNLGITLRPGLSFRIVKPKAGNSLYEFWRSLRSYNYPKMYIRHSNFKGQLTPISSSLDRKDATFRMVPGLADPVFDPTAGAPENVSFESWNYNDWYLVDEDGRLVLRRRPVCDHSFDCRATFRKQAGLTPESGVSFESYSHSDHFIRHRNFRLYVEEGDGELFREDATFREVRPWYDPEPHYISLQVDGSDDFMLYRESSGEYKVMADRLQSPLDRIAATFRKMPALDCPEDDRFFSLEALIPQQAPGFWRLRSFAGYHVRHQFFHLKVSERRPINLVSRPEPLAIQPDRFGSDALCEEFMVKHDTGAVAYIGSYTGVQSPVFRLLRYFAEELSSSSDAVVRLGDVWNSALLSYMENDFKEIEKHLREGDSFGTMIFEHVHKMMLFGDPSLRIPVPKR